MSLLCAKTVEVLPLSTDTCECSGGSVLGDTLRKALQITLDCIAFDYSGL